MKKTFGLSGRSDHVVSIIYSSWVRAFGSTDAASFLFMLSRWHDKGSREDGFIYKSRDEIEAETGIKRKRQISLRASLEKTGVLETKLLRANGHATLHYKLNVDVAQKMIDIAEKELDKGRV